MKPVILLLISLFLTLFNTSAIAQSLEKTLEEIDKLSKSYFPAEDPGAVVLIGQKGEVVYHKAYGMGDLELDVPLNKDMVFPIASNTKQFTAMAILKLVEEGKISLNDSLSKYFENLPKPKQSITIHQLLSHTGGIESLMDKPFWYEDLNFWRMDLTVDSLINLTINDTLLFNPGENFRYGNTSYYLLGKIIEIISNQTYETYIQENLFDKVGMQNAYHGSHEAVIKNRAKGYKKQDQQFLNADYLSYTQIYSAGEIMATAGDLFKWYNAVFNNQLVDSSLVKKAVSPVKLNDNRDSGYGLGYFVTPVAEVTTYNHAGMMNGYFVNSIYEPTTELCVIVLSNWEYSPAVILGFEIASILVSNLYHHTDYTSDNDILGEYQNNNVILKIGEKDGDYFFENQKGRQVKMKRSSQNQYFFGSPVPGIIIFEKGSNNNPGRIKFKRYFSSFYEYVKVR